MSTLHYCGPALGILLAVACAGCASEDARFVVKHAPDFTAVPRTVSVFGVFRDGQLSTASWTEIAPQLTDVLGKESCDVGFGDKLQEAKPDLFASTSETAKAEGITDELLDQFAPMAAGDVIMVVYVHGKTHGPVPSGQESGTAMANSMGGRSNGGGGRGGGGRGRGQMGPAPPPRPIPDDLEIAASLFSVRSHHVLARTTMIYSGPSFENALKLFMTRLRTEIPGATCTGWNWKDHE